MWKGDTLVADFEELETMDASEIHSKRFNAEGVAFLSVQNVFFGEILWDKLLEMCET